MMIVIYNDSYLFTQCVRWTTQQTKVEKACHRLLPLIVVQFMLSKSHYKFVLHSSK